MVAKKTGKAIQKGKKLTAGTLTRPSSVKMLRGTHLAGGALTRPPLMTRKVFTRPVSTN